MTRSAVFLFFISSFVGAQQIALQPATDVRAFDTRNDAGGSITITWKKSADTTVTEYKILRTETKGQDYTVVGSTGPDAETYADNTVANKKNYYYYIVRATDGTNTADSRESNPAQASPQFFNTDRINILLGLLILSGFILFYINYAKKKRELFVRRITGLSAIDEAIGRATEMGKPVLFVPGIMDVDDPQTLAGMSILARVAEKTATYDTPLFVPTSKSMAMTMAQQIVRESYLKVGRPDAFKPDNIRYLTDDQFAYVSAVDGIMVREKPAANFYLGTFYAESLILAETGHSTGAIQIAGTAMVDQLPFFVAACDYTLLGEELYAASAYLSKEPVQLGSLKGQDLGKVLFIAIIIAGLILRLFGWDFFTNWFAAL
jgi:hypothetical protein